MFELIDYKEEVYTDGFGAGIDYFYKVRNVNTKEETWVDRYEFNNIKNQGFLKK